MATGTGPPHPAAPAGQCTDELGENDLRVVFKALHSVAEKYKILGVEMNVKMNEIKKIQSQCSDPSDCLLEVLSVRLKQIPSLTWRDIDTALRSDTVGEPQLADRVRRQYGHLYSPDPSFEASLDQEPGKNMSEMTKSKKKAKKEKSARKYTQQDSNEEVSESERYRKPSKTNDNEAVVTKNQQKTKKYLHRKRHSKLGKQYIEKESKREGKTQRKRKVTKYDNESEVLCGRQDRYYKVKHSEKRAQKEVQIESESESSASSSEQEIVRGDNSDSTEELYSSEQEEDSADEVSETERYQKPTEHPREDEYPHSDRETPVIRAKGKSKISTTLLPKKKSKMSGSEGKPEEKTKQKKKAMDQSGSMLMQHEIASDVDGQGESAKGERTSDTHGVGRKKHKRYRKRTPKKKKSEFGTSSEEEPLSSTFCTVEREKQKKVQKKVLEYPRHKETQKHYEVASATEYHKQQTRVPTESDYSASGSDDEQRQTPEPKRKTIQAVKYSTIYSAESNEEEGETQLGVKTKASYRQYKLSEAEFDRRVDRKRKQPSKPRQTSKHVKLQQYSPASGKESHSIQTDTSVEKSPNFATCTSDIQEKQMQVVKAGRKKRFYNNSPPANPFSYPPSRSGTQSDSECKRREAKHQRHLKRVKRRRRMKQESSSSSETDDDSSSPESDMLRNLTESENKGLIKAFKHCFGKLCLAIKDPDKAAVELQAKRLLSCSMMENLLTSPESQQAKAITLVRALKKRIKSCPARVFTIIEVFLRNEILEEVGRELRNETGKVCPERTTCMLDYQLPPLDRLTTMEPAFSNNEGDKTMADTAKNINPSHVTEGASDATTSQEVSLSVPQSDLSPVLAKYKQYLQSCYKAKVLAPADKYLPTLESPFINLAMIRRGHYNHEQRDEFTRRTLHGGVDQILENKAPINIEDLLTPEDRDERYQMRVKGGKWLIHEGRESRMMPFMVPRYQRRVMGVPFLMTENMESLVAPKYNY